LKASNSGFDVAEEITKRTERQHCTFTDNSMVDADDINLEFSFDPQLRDITDNPITQADLDSVCKDQTENNIQYNSSIKTAAQHIEESVTITDPHIGHSGPTTEIAIPPVQDEVFTEESLFLMDFQHSFTSQTQGHVDKASGIFNGSQDFVQDLIDQEIAKIEKQNHEYFNLDSVTEMDDIDVDLLARSFFVENKKLDKSSRRNTKGPKPQNLGDYPAKNRVNILRCREYRKKKKENQMNLMNEMNVLENRNKELRGKEQKMTDLILRMKRLIRERTIIV